MKTLQEFWRWFDNEKPDESTALDLSNERLSAVAQDALYDAADYIRERRCWECECDATNLQALKEYPAEMRDLSLVICAALLKMHESVPEGEPKPESAVVGPNLTPWWTVNSGPSFKREYLIEWVDAHGNAYADQGPLLGGTRQIGKTESIKESVGKMNEMFESGKIAVWHEAQVVNGVLTVVDKAKETP